jgi:hypothetical protein
MELEKPDGNLTASEGRRRKFTVHADTRRMYASAFQCMPSNFTQLGRSQSPAMLVAGAARGLQTPSRCLRHRTEDASTSRGVIILRHGVI